MTRKPHNEGFAYKLERQKHKDFEKEGDDGLDC